MRQAHLEQPSRFVRWMHHFCMPSTIFLLSRIQLNIEIPIPSSDLLLSSAIARKTGIFESQSCHHRGLQMRGRDSHTSSVGLLSRRRAGWRSASMEIYRGQAQASVLPVMPLLGVLIGVLQVQGAVRSGVCT